MAIDHVTLDVEDITASRKFYSAALRPLGYEARAEHGESVGFGDSRGIDFWIARRGEPSTTHVALSAPNRDSVEQFHEAAMAGGGRDNGAPGLRPHYHENYYAAYVIDPDGNNIEAVCHKPE
jgi:catechol 2,3-dioxygenase-like lactoylglutathione lyase family enzyme